ncbi:MAG: hypothetical protein LBL53_01620 [Endomicrobium sp.]|nr:hypothetical protein [Endomicrobium sp.]
MKKNKLLTFIIFCVVLVLVNTIIYMYKNKEINKNDYISFVIFFENINDIYMYIVSYCKIDNTLKILILNNDNIKNVNFKNFNIIYNGMKNIISNNLKLNYYLFFNHKILNKIDCYKKDFFYIENKNNHYEKDLYNLDKINFITRLFKLKYLKNILLNYSNFKTNITKLNLLIFILKIYFLNPKLIFCEFHKNKCKKYNEQNIKLLFNNIYYNNNFDNKNINNNILIEIKNASGKSRIAEKTSWYLRENNFDVLDWKNSKSIYKKTIIIIYKGNLKQIFKLFKFFKNAIVLISYNKNNYTDLCIFLGKNCPVIYDNFDKFT